MTRLALFVVFAVAAVPPAARADLPTFTTLDRMDGQSRLGLQLGLHHYDELKDAYGLRVEIYGQHVVSQGFGLYGQLPMSHLLIEDADDETAIQNLEAGGFLLLGSPGRRFVLRGGISLPTADDEVGGFVANALTSWERIIDIAGIAPDSTWLRLSFSPILVFGQIVVRGDVGLDLRLSDRNSVRDDDVFGHLNGGFGLLINSWAVLFELANVDNLDDSGGSRTTFSLGARLLDSTQVHFGLVVPVDEPTDMLIFSFGIGG